MVGISKVEILIIKNIFFTYLFATVVVSLIRIYSQWDNILKNRSHVLTIVFEWSYLDVGLAFFNFGWYFLLLPWAVHRMVKCNLYYWQMLLIGVLVAVIFYIPFYTDGINGFPSLGLILRVSLSIMACCFFIYIHSRDLINYYKKEEFS